VCESVETWGQQEKFGVMRMPTLATDLDGRTSEELCSSAATLAASLKAKAIVVYTRRGYMAQYLSRRRPDCPILAVTGAALSPAMLHCATSSHPSHRRPISTQPLAALRSV